MARTKIKLEYPFNQRWKYGYLVTNPEGRRNVILYNSHQDRTTISYARYLMSVHLGRFLEEHEHVDHIDGDKTNDTIENLQILTLAENNRKASPGKWCVDLICPNCGVLFTRPRNRTHLVVKTKRATFCSRTCAASFQLKERWHGMTEEMKKAIENNVVRVYKKKPDIKTGA